MQAGLLKPFSLKFYHSLASFISMVKQFLMNPSLSVSFSSCEEGLLLLILYGTQMGHQTVLCYCQQDMLPFLIVLNFQFFRVFFKVCDYTY